MSNAADDLLLRAHQARKQHRLEDARQDLVQAVDLLRWQAAGTQLAQALRLLAEIERKLRDVASARQHYDEAIALYRRYADPLTVAHAVRHLGDVHFEAGRADLAEPCYREALELYRAQSEAPLLELANAIRSMAVLKDDRGEIDQSRLLWLEARDLYARTNIDAGVAESSKRLARLAG